MHSLEVELQQKSTEKREGTVM